MDDPYKDLFDAAFDVILFVDAKGNIMDINNAGERLTGYKLSALRKMNIYTDLVVVEDLNRMKRAIRELIEGIDQSFNVRWKTKSGKIIQFELASTARFDENGKFISTRCILRDITAKSLAEKSLVTSEERLKLIYNNTNDIMALVRVEGKNKFIMESANKRWNDIGIEHNIFTKKLEYLEKDIVVYLKEKLDLDKEELKLRVQQWNKAVETCEIVKFERVTPLPDFSLLYHETTVNPIKNNSEKCTHLLLVVTDITQRKIAELNLKKSEERLKLANEATQTGTYDWFPVKNSEYWDERMHEIFGLNPNSKKNRNSYFFSVLHPDDVERIRIEFTEKLDSKCKDLTFTSEYKIVLKKEGIKHISTHGYFFRDANGIVTRVIGSCRDITRQKETSIRLKESEIRYRTLYNQTPAMLHSIDLKGRLLSVSDKWLEVLGYEEQEVLGLKSTKFLTKESSEYAAKEILPKFMIEGFCTDIPYQFVKKNGDVIDVLLSATSEKDSNGIIVRSLAVLNDVTEHKKATKELAESEERFERFSNSAFEGIGIAVNGIVRDANNRLLEMSGYKKEELIGFPILKIIHPDDQKMVLEKLKDEFEPPYEFRLLRKNKTFLWAEARAAYAMFQGEKARVAGIYDVTQRKNSEEALRKSEERFRSVVEDQTEMIVRWEKGGVRTFVNNAYCKAYGLSRTDAIGTSFFDLISKKDLVKVKNRIKSITQKHQLSTDQHEVILPDGTKAWHEWTDRGFFDEKGNIVDYQSIGRDVTFKLKADQQLKEAFTEVSKLKRQLEEENVYLREEIELVFNYEDMVYGSAEFSAVLTQVEQVAPTDATVLILGETGTGKELIARAIHNISLRKDKPLIKVNCAAIPHDLIESELFGHEKGSFTGAIRDRLGKFELADGGTIFLDEIGELPLDMQPKLLRALQEGEIERVGGEVTRKVDVRVIAATNKNLKVEVENKEFREDLYFRLNVFPILIPPLRERVSDIRFLVEHFVDKYSTKHHKEIKFISENTMNQIESYEWPGNIRELENSVERGIILSKNKTLVFPEFPGSKKKVSIKATALSFEDVQRNHIIKVLQNCDWKIDGLNGAAMILDLKPSTLRDRMKKLDIKRPSK